MSLRRVRASRIAAVVLPGCALLAAALPIDGSHGSGGSVRNLLDVSALEPRHVDLEETTHLGRPSLRLRFKPGLRGEGLAIVKGVSLRDGTVEVDVVGRPAAGASATARGFIGIAFRVAAKPDTFGCFYIRPTNARAEDQLRRNHSTQYESMPDFPWSRLRSEFPGVYESYADIDAAGWTHLRIEFTGPKARLYVNRAPQPALIVSDLRHEPAAGAVALWIGDETDGWFSNLEITPATP